MECSSSCQPGKGWDRGRGTGAGAQGVQELHGAPAGGTADGRFVRKHQHRLPGPQQTPHPGIPLPCRGAEPAEVPHPHEPARQHVLQEPPDKLLPAQPGDALVAARPVGPAEAHAVLIHCRDPRGIQRGLLHFRVTYSNARRPPPAARPSPLTFPNLPHNFLQIQFGLDILRPSVLNDCPSITLNPNATKFMLPGKMNIPLPLAA